MRTVLFIILAIVLGTITAALLAGNSPVEGLVWVLASIAWYWVLQRGHRRPA